MAPEPVTVTAKAFNPATGRVDLPVFYTARDRQEAHRWINFNKDWMQDFTIHTGTFVPQGKGLL